MLKRQTFVWEINYLKLLLPTLFTEVPISQSEAWRCCYMLGMQWGKRCRGQARYTEISALIGELEEMSSSGTQLKEEAKDPVFSLESKEGDDSANLGRASALYMLTSTRDARTKTCLSHAPSSSSSSLRTTPLLVRDSPWPFHLHQADSCLPE